MIVEPGRGAPARCRATRQALNGWYHRPIHMSPSDVQEVTNGRFMRWPITPPTAVNAWCGHACAQVPLQQSNYLTCLKLKKQPSTRIYHVTRREKTHDRFNFLWLISRREKNTNSASASEGNSLSVQSFSGFLTPWQARFILENQVWLHIQSADMLPRYVCCLDFPFIYRKSLYNEPLLC